jgi:hypothetical protein
MMPLLPSQGGVEEADANGALAVKLGEATRQNSEGGKRGLFAKSQTGSTTSIRSDGSVVTETNVAMLKRSDSGSFSEVIPAGSFPPFCGACIQSGAY